jgi:hypothetical protein
MYVTYTTPLLKSQSVRRAEKVKIYDINKTCGNIRSRRTLLKGWQFLNEKFLRKIFGANKVNENWIK